MIRKKQVLLAFITMGAVFFSSQVFVALQSERNEVAAQQAEGTAMEALEKIRRLEVRTIVTEKLVREFGLTVDEATKLAERVAFEIVEAKHSDDRKSPERDPGSTQSPNPLPTTPSDPIPTTPSDPVPTPMFPVDPDDPTPTILQTLLCDTGVAVALGMQCSQQAMQELACSLGLQAYIPLNCLFQSV